MEAKQVRAKKIVKNYMWYSMGAGLIPIPFVDIAAVGGLQIKMLADLSKHYGVEFKANRGKSIISALLGVIIPNNLSKGALGSLIKMVPVIGQIGGGISIALFTGAATYAIGKVFIQHFEAGGTILTFDPDKVKDYFKEQFSEGEKLAKAMKSSDVEDVEVEEVEVEEVKEEE